MRFCILSCILRSARLLRRFRQVVQHQTVRISKVLLHHALNVRGSDCLQSREIRIHSRRISEQHRSFTERERFSVARLTLAQLVGDDLVLGFLQLSRGDRRVLQVS